MTRYSPPEYNLFDYLILWMYYWICLWFAWKVAEICIGTMLRNCACCRRLRDWDGILTVCGRKIPITPRGYAIMQNMRDIMALECRDFADFQDPEKQETERDLITDGSAACVICWESYEAKEKVLRLKCGHHFHESCVSEWLLIHNRNRECPICRQDFRTAENQYGRQSVHISMTEIVIPEDIQLLNEKERDNARDDVHGEDQLETVSLITEWSQSGMLSDQSDASQRLSVQMERREDSYDNSQDNVQRGEQLVTATLIKEASRLMGMSSDQADDVQQLSVEM